MIRNDDDSNDKSSSTIKYKVTSLMEAYNLLILSFNPLKTIPSQVLMLACRMFYIKSTNDKIQFMLKNEPYDKVQLTNQEKLSRLLIETKSKTMVSSSSSSSSSSDSSFIISSSSILNPEITLSSSPFNNNNNDNNNKMKNDQNILSTKINGTWDLHISIIDKSPYLVKTYDLGSLRRNVLVDNSICTDTYPVFFGMNSVTVQFKLSVDRLFLGSLVK